MPEGPELFLSSLYINRICSGLVFSGKVVKNPIHKCQDISWDEPSYAIFSESRGKELTLHLRSYSNNCKKEGGEDDKVLSILFTFGMSGKFEFVAADNMPKHSHLTFFTKGEPKMGLAFVDYRRFGKWIEGGHWSDDRGPCVIQEHASFINNVAANLDNNAFNKPICEVMLNQKFFNGIGNYLRAEILFRCKVAPFENARSVLKLGELKQTPKAKVVKESVEKEIESKDIGTTNGFHDLKRFHEKKVKKPKTKEVIKMETSEELDQNENTYNFTSKGLELLQLCGSVPHEVIDIGSTKYSLSELYKDESEGKSFNKWLQCYYQEGMKNMADHNNRTIWFSGPAGPMAPKEQKVRGKRKAKKSSKDETKSNSSEKECVSETNTQANKRKSLSAKMTRTKLKTLKNKDVKAADRVKTEGITLDTQSRKRNKDSSSDADTGKKKIKKNQSNESVLIPKRLTRSSIKSEQ